MPVADDEEPQLRAYASAEVAGVDEDLGKCKEEHKHLKIMDLLKPIPKNPEEHPLSSHMGE